MLIIYIIFGTIFGGIVGYFIAFSLPTIFKISSLEGNSGYAALYFTMFFVPICAILNGYFSYKFQIVGQFNLVLFTIFTVISGIIYLLPDNQTYIAKMSFKNDSAISVIARHEDASSKGYTETIAVGKKDHSGHFPIYKGRSLTISFSDENKTLIAEKKFVPYSLNPPKSENLILEFSLTKENEIKLLFVIEKAEKIEIPQPKNADIN